MMFTENVLFYTGGKRNVKHQQRIQNLCFERIHLLNFLFSYWYVIDQLALLIKSKTIKLIQLRKQHFVHVAHLPNQNLNNINPRKNMNTVVV